MSDVIKSFGTILSDNSYVKLQYSKYQSKKTKVTKEMPEIFNPIEKWGFFLSGVRNQGKCGACWAMSTAKALADRYSILAVGAITEDFSAYEMIMCQGTIFPYIPLDKDSLYQVNLQAHTQGGCNGNSITTAIDFMYSIGLVSTSCVNHGLFDKYNIKDITTLENPESIPMCQSILGIHYDRCLDRTRAVNYYRIATGYQVDKDVESIKHDIYKWGPVVGGFMVYEGFIKHYDGKSIYMGPEKDEKIEGGHAVEILGWGKEDGVDFWWICNSWGTEWGLSGFFKMKMNIPECKLEENVFGFIPDFPGFKPEMSLYASNINPELAITRNAMDIDHLTGYKKTSIKEIKDGKLKGVLSPIFKKPVPNMMEVWLGDVTPDEFDFYSYVPRFISISKGYNIYKILIWIVALVVCFFIGRKIRTLKLLNKKRI